MSRTLDQLLAQVEKEGKPQPCYLVTGDRVVAEPAAERLAEAIAKKFGCEATTHKRPARLLPLLDDLRTFSLFDPAKVMVVIESAVVADLSAAAGLVDQAIKVLPVDPRTEELSTRERDAAIRLVQAIRLFQLDPYTGSPDQLLGQVPDWAFQGENSLKKGKRGRARAKAQVKKLREQSAGLLELARGAGIEGQAEGAAEAVVELVQNGLPDGHVLVLAESSVVDKHPLLTALEERGALIQLARVEAGRRGFEGLDALTEELHRQTGVGIDGRAVQELARRTLRKESDRGRSDAIDADSTARFAAEYRKLAEVASGDRIDAATVQNAVEDRGEEDVWKILDDIGAGRAGAANSRLRRHLASADDAMSMRLSFFSLLATYCRHLTAIDGALDQTGLPRGERNYNRFKNAIAPKLQGNLPGGAKSPISGLHPFRLHKAYLAASRMPKSEIAGLVGRVLEAEMQMKGESRSPDAALQALVAAVAAPGAR